MVTKSGWVVKVFFGIFALFLKRNSAGLSGCIFQGHYYITSGGKVQGKTLNIT